MPQKHEADHLLQDGTKDNPAVHVKRKGNDVVKRASELAVLDPEVSILLLCQVQTAYHILISCGFCCIPIN